jgi:hypothetical protein
MYFGAIGSGALLNTAPSLPFDFIAMTSADPPTFSVPSAPNPESIRLMVVGTPQVVQTFIALQHRLGFAEVTAWSPPLPTPHDNQVLRILTKRIAPLGGVAFPETKKGGCPRTAPNIIR